MSMRVFVVDVNVGTYYTDDIEPKLEDYYRVIGCELVDIIEVSVGGKQFDLIADDEGMFVPHGARPSVFTNGDQIVSVGTVIFCHCDKNGNETGLNDGDAALLAQSIVKIEADGENEKGDDRNPRWYAVRGVEMN